MKKTKKIVILFSILMHTITPSAVNTAFSERNKIHKHTYFNNLIKHFSYIKCLAISIYFLSRLHKKNYYYKPCNVIEQKDYIQIDATFFFHTSTKSFLQK